MAARKAIRVLQHRAPAFARLSLAFVLAMAFTLQCYVTQTHIHVGATAATAGFVLDQRAALKGAQPDKQSPAGDDSTNCLFCQEMLYAGQYVAPAAVVFVLPAQSVSFVPPSIAVARVIARASHSWQGRAPPRL